MRIHKNRSPIHLSVFAAVFMCLFGSLEGATITWNGAGNDGGRSWDTPANWIGNSVPRVDDDVVVPSLNNGRYPVILRGVTVKSLILRSGASLTVSGAGSTFETASATVVGGASLSAMEGGQILLPGVATYQISDPNAPSPSLSAEGVGSLLDLSGLNRLSSIGNGISVYARNGATVLLSSLPQVIQGSVSFDSQGSGSEIHLPSFVRMVGGNVSVSDGGKIYADSLERLTQVSLSVSGSSSLPLPALSIIEGGGIYVNEGAQWSPPSRITNLQISSLDSAGAGSLLDFPDLTALSVGNVTARDGGQIRFALISQLNGGAFNSTGKGSRIEFPTLNRRNEGAFSVSESGQILADGLLDFIGSVLEITGPGSLPLPSLRNFDSSSVNLKSGAAWAPPARVSSYQTDRPASFTADGDGSLLDLSGLAQISTSTDGVSGIGVTASGGAEARLSSLTQFIQGRIGFNSTGVGSRVDLTSLVRLSNGGLAVEGGGSILASSLQRINSGYLYITGASTLSVTSLANMDFSGASVFGGAHWSPPNRITEIAGGGSFAASGAGSVLDLSRIIRITPGIAGTSFIAESGGRVDLSALRRIEGVDNTGFSSFGVDSVVQAPQLATISSVWISAVDQGILDMGSGVPQLDIGSSRIAVSNRGRLTSGTIRAAAGGTLEGDGRISANLELNGTFNSSGVFNPLTIDGDLVLRVGSRLNFVVTGTETPSQHEQLIVGGRAQLAGTLAVSPQNASLIEINDGFRLMRWTEFLGEFDNFANLTAGSGQEFTPNYNTNHLSLKVTVGQGPSIVAALPAAAVSGILDQMTLTFSEPIDPNNFSTDDIVLVGPDGSTIPVLTPVRVNSRTYQVSFEPQTTNGNYRVTVGPDISDFADNRMVTAFIHTVRLQALQGAAVITIPPTSRIVGRGSATELSVTATSDSPVTYLWRLNGQAISGATSSVYRIASADSSNAGRYTVVVSNAAGSVESEPANLSLFELATFAGTVINGPLGATYRIDYREALAPENAWQTATNVTLLTNPFVWVDLESRSESHRYYRAVLVGP